MLINLGVFLRRGGSRTARSDVAKSENCRARVIVAGRSRTTPTMKAPRGLPTVCDHDSLGMRGGLERYIKSSYWVVGPHQQTEPRRYYYNEPNDSCSDCPFGDRCYCVHRRRVCSSSRASAARRAYSRPGNQSSSNRGRLSRASGRRPATANLLQFNSFPDAVSWLSAAVSALTATRRDIAPRCAPSKSLRGGPSTRQPRSG